MGCGGSSDFGIAANKKIKSSNKKYIDFRRCLGVRKDKLEYMENL